MRKKIKLHGVVGVWWDETDSKTISDQIDALKEGDEVVVHINSPGGSATQGVAIYNALKGHPGPVRVVVDALAASSASIIAMAGDEIVMREGALMMIHNPWSMTVGDAEEHRKSADMLDKHRDALAEIYAGRTGKTREEINDLLSSETWMTAEEAVEMGFATEKAGQAEETKDAAALLASFASELEKFQKVPGELRGQVAAAVRAAQLTPKRADAQGVGMTDEEREKLEAEARAAREAEIRAEAQAAERKRIATIQDVCARVGKPDMAQALIAEGVSVDVARERAIDALAQKTEPVVNAAVGVTAGDDARDKFVKGATQALSARAGLEAREPGNPYNYASLKDLAAEVGERAGMSVRGMDPMAMVGQVMAQGMHTTSDFPLILESVMRRTLGRAYDEAPETFQEWTSEGRTPDFKPLPVANLNTYPSLPKVPEGSEYTYATIGEGGQVVQVATYGSIFAITRQAIINDDLSVMTRIPQKQGRAALRTVGDLVYKTLLGNVLPNGSPIFSAGNNNYVSSNGALTADNLEKARAALRKQEDADGNSINITPGILLVPAALEGTALRLMTAEFFAAGSGASAIPQPNTLRNLAKVVVDPRLDAASAATWYLIADPAAFDFIQVTYLNGNKMPYLERKDGWSVDGVEYKVRIDAGVSALDFRTAYKSVGS